jgi:ubiquinone/menaquinone biosynthesis C-methylase UbiE
VKNYRLYRSGIPVVVASILVSETRSTTGHRKLLDLGTGTGFVIDALKNDFNEIIGVDPDPDMLVAARVDVVPIPSQRIEYVCISAEEYFPEVSWEPNLVTMSRAFHWFDEDKVLRNLETYVARKG